MKKDALLFTLTRAINQYSLDFFNNREKNSHPISSQNEGHIKHNFNLSNHSNSNSNSNPNQSAHLSQYRFYSGNHNLSIFIQRYDDWLSQATQNGQLLNYGPKDWVIAVAFLRLMGIRQSSLSQFSYNFHTGKTIINTVQSDHFEPQVFLTLSVEIAMASMVDFNLPPERVNIPSCNKNIKYPLEFARLKMISDAEKVFKSRLLDDLYHEIAHMDDGQIDIIIDRFIPNCSPDLKPILRVKLLKAKEFLLNRAALEENSCKAKAYCDA